MSSKTTRLPIDLIEAAEAEGRGEHRSAAKQLEYWARFGMFFAGHTSSSHRRIQRAIAGEAPLGGLDVNNTGPGPVTIATFVAGDIVGAPRWPDWSPEALVTRWPVSTRPGPGVGGRWCVHRDAVAGRLRG